MAERILTSALAQDVAAGNLPAAFAESFVVDSAGTSDEEAGNPVDPRAVRVLEDAGYDAAGHTARQITSEWLAERDLAIAMTRRHFAVLTRLAEHLPEERRPEIRMFRSFDPACADLVADLPPHTAPQDSALDVNDPWYGGPADFLVTRDLLEAGMPGVLAWIRARATPEPASLVPTSFRSE